MCIDSACSSSLVALHVGAESLRKGKTDLERVARLVVLPFCVPHKGDRRYVPRLRASCPRAPRRLQGFGGLVVPGHWRPGLPGASRGRVAGVPRRPAARRRLR